MKKYLSTTKGSSRRSSNNNFIFIAGAIALCGLVLLWLVPYLLAFVAGFIFMPISYVHGWFMNSEAALPTYFRDRSELLAEQRQLEQRIAELQNHDAATQAAISADAELAALANSATSSSRIVANLVSRPGSLPYDVFLIDKGSEADVKRGAPVYVGSEQAIGFIAKVYQSMSLVVLATSPGYESVVYIYGPDIYTTAIGQGGGVLEVSVPQGIPLKVDDPVIIPALHAGVYGTISHVESNPSEPEQRGYVALEVPLSSVRVVAVGSDPLNNISFDDARAAVSEVRKDLLRVPVPEGVLVEVGTSTASTTATSTVGTSTNETEL